jgi:hypothetical protein
MGGVCLVGVAVLFSVAWLFAKEAKAREWGALNPWHSRDTRGVFAFATSFGGRVAPVFSLGERFTFAFATLVFGIFPFERVYLFAFVLALSFPFAFRSSLGRGLAWTHIAGVVFVGLVLDAGWVCAHLPLLQC